MSNEKTVSEMPERAQFLKQHGYHDMVKVENLAEHPVVVRGNRGNSGAYFMFKNVNTQDAHISEMKPGGTSKKHRHANEAVIYIVTGWGYSEISPDNVDVTRVEWKEGDLLAIPAMYWHQHFNSDPDAPARYLAVTTVPILEKLVYEVIEQEANPDK